LELRPAIDPQDLTVLPPDVQSVHIEPGAAAHDTPDLGALAAALPSGSGAPVLPHPEQLAAERLVHDDSSPPAALPSGSALHHGGVDFESSFERIPDETSTTARLPAATHGAAAEAADDQGTTSVEKSSDGLLASLFGTLRSAGAPPWQGPEYLPDSTPEKDKDQRKS
jgi:hypothetical protein